MRRLGLFFFVAAIAVASLASESSSFSQLVTSFAKNVKSKTETCEGRPDCVCADISLNGSFEARFSKLRLCPMDEAGAVLYETFRPDGSLVDACSTLDKKFHGVCRSFHPNGALAAETRFSRGCQHGEEKTWHANGVVASEGRYVDGAPDGLDVRRGPDGELTAEVLWNRGRAVRIKKRNEQGKFVAVPVRGKEIVDWPCLEEVF